jgi:hypothetical protein
VAGEDGAVLDASVATVAGELGTTVDAAVVVVDLLLSEVVPVESGVGGLADFTDDFDLVEVDVVVAVVIVSAKALAICAATSVQS